MLCLAPVNPEPWPSGRGSVCSASPRGRPPTPPCQEPKAPQKLQAGQRRGHSRGPRSRTGQPHTQTLHRFGPGSRVTCHTPPPDRNGAHRRHRPGAMPAVPGGWGLGTVLPEPPAAGGVPAWQWRAGPRWAHGVALLRKTQQGSRPSGRSPLLAATDCDVCEAHAPLLIHTARPTAGHARLPSLSTPRPSHAGSFPVCPP